MPEVHSSIGASSAERWMNCPASVIMSQNSQAKKESSVFAEEGTAAHALAEWCLVNGRQPAEMMGSTIHSGKNSYEINSEMVDAVKMYVDTCNNALRYGEVIRHGDSVEGKEEVTGKMEVENRFNLNWLHKGMFGTCDCAVSIPSKRKIIIIDLKYGAGKPVFAEGNPQLRYYALGVLGDEISGKSKYDEVVMCIVQPRHELSLVNYTRMSIEDLYSWAFDTLLPAAKRTQDPKAPLVMGGYCKWCPAFGFCPQLEIELSHIAGMNLSTVTGEPDKKVSLPDPRSLTSEQKSRILLVSKLFDPWVKEVEKTLLQDALSGRMIPGWKLVKKKAGNRRWRDERTVVNAFESRLGDSIYSEKKLVTPAKLEKMIDKEEVAMYCYRPEAGLELAPESDKRPSENVNEDILSLFD